jgi:hypothetical protein
MITDEMAKDALRVFNGGLVEEPNAHTASGFALYYRPESAMRAALSAALPVQAEPVAWRYRHKSLLPRQGEMTAGKIVIGPWHYTDDEVTARFDARSEWYEVEPLYASPAPSPSEDDLIAAREFIDWVDTWVSNHVSQYSFDALDGLFSMTRHRIAAIRSERKRAGGQT